MSGSFATIETHIPDFDEDICGLPLRFTFLSCLRDDVHFPSLEALKRQLEIDWDEVRLYNPLFFRSFAMNVPE